MSEQISYRLSPLDPTSLTVRPFDYVKDGEGWLYVVRGTLTSGEILLKAIRSPGDSVKFAMDLPLGVSEPQLRRFPYGGGLEYIASPRDLVQIYGRKRRSLDGESNPVAQQIARAIADVSGGSYLFGSRRLGIHREDSDWDVLVLRASRPDLVQSAVVGALGPGARSPGALEISARVERYAAPRGLLSRETLSQLFWQTTMYVYHHDLEIGLFFASHKETPIPSLPVLRQAPTHDLGGAILRSNGSSHHMPRQISIRDSTGALNTVETTLWELGGLEECAGSTVHLHQARMLNHRHWWFGGPGIELKLCEDSQD